MSIFIIFKNNFYRLLLKRSIIITALVFIPLMIGSAVYFTGKMEVKANIAIVSENNNFAINDKYLKVTVLDKKPKMSELLLNKYDSVIIDNGNENFEVISIKGEKTKSIIEGFLKNPHDDFKDVNSQQNRGVGTNILGFLMMFILQQAVALIILYPEDRDFGIFKRILSSPFSRKKYLLAHGIFNFSIIYIPVFLSVVITREVFKVDIGFTYGVLAMLLAIITLLGTVFALFITSLIDNLDNSILFSSIIIILTSIIAGGLYSFSYDNKFLDLLVNMLPQKQYLTLVQGIEAGGELFKYFPQFLYIILSILILFAAADFVLEKKIKIGKY